MPCENGLQRKLSTATVVIYYIYNSDQVWYKGSILVYYYGREELDIAQTEGSALFWERARI